MDWGLGSLARQPKEGLPLELQIRTARRRLSFLLCSPQPRGAAAHIHHQSHQAMHLRLTASCTAAGMHEEAQSGEAAHAAYKGGLAPGLARRLHSFLDLSAIPPALPAATLWNSSEAAAEELFRSPWRPHQRYCPKSQQAVHFKPQCCYARCSQQMNTLKWTATHPAGTWTLMETAA